MLYSVIEVSNFATLRWRWEKFYFNAQTFYEIATAPLYLMNFNVIDGLVLNELTNLASISCTSFNFLAASLIKKNSYIFFDNSSMSSNFIARKNVYVIFEELMFYIEKKLGLKRLAITNS